MQYRVFSSVALCVALFFSALILGGSGVESFQQSKVGTSLGLSALALFLYDLMTFFHNRNTEGKTVYFRLAYVVLDLAAAVCSFLTGNDIIFFLAASIMYLSIFILKRIVSIIRRPKKRNVVLNVLMLVVHTIVLLVAITGFSLDELGGWVAALLVGVSMFFTCLVNIGMMALSNFKVELLRKIIRKTYAGEILFGLLLLVVSFSLAFTMLEPNVATFGDALWYCFAIVTTIGFGDLVAVSILGRILSVLLGLYGMIVVAIITSIIVNFYNEVKHTPDDEDDLKAQEETAREELPEADAQPQENTQETPEEPKTTAERSASQESDPYEDPYNTEE